MFGGRFAELCNLYADLRCYFVTPAKWLNLFAKATRNNFFPAEKAIFMMIKHLLIAGWNDIFCSVFENSS